MILVDNFFDTTFDLDSEKQKIIDFIDMKKNQDSAEAVFFDKYHEVQTCSGEKFKINALKSKLWNGTDISNLKPKFLLTRRIVHQKLLFLALSKLIHLILLVQNPSSFPCLVLSNSICQHFFLIINVVKKNQQ